MVKSLIGALLGSLTLAVIVSLTGLLLGWLGFDKSLLVAGGISAIGGAILGWIRPAIFTNTLLFFLEPSVFD